MLRRVRRLRQLSTAEWIVLGQASLLLPLMWLALRVLPLRTTRAVVAWLARPRVRKPHSLAPVRISWAVRVVARRLKVTCLPQALVAYILLRRRGYPAVLKMGVQYHPGDTLAAHAWVEIDHQPIIGHLNNLDQYVTLDAVWEVPPST